MPDSAANQHRPYRVGLTGGIASGKSAAADFFAQLGGTVVDTDVIARELVEPGSPALAEIRDHFGAAVIADDGSLDRRSLRAIVFGDDAERRRLEAILHPRIRESALAKADAAPTPYVVIVVPLLFESPIRDSVDRVLVIDCSEATQLRRLRARDGETDESARRMIAAQATRQQRLSIADDVVGNEGDLDELRKNISQLHRKYLRMAAGRR